MAYASGCSVKVYLTRKAYQSNEQEYSKQIRKTLSETRQRLRGQRFVKHFRTYFLHRAPGESVTTFTTPSIACCCVSRSLSERFCCCRSLPRLLPFGSAARRLSAHVELHHHTGHRAARPLACCAARLFQSLALTRCPQPADLISGPSAETGMVSSDRHRGVGEARGGAQWASRSRTPSTRCVARDGFLAGLRVHDGCGVASRVPTSLGLACACRCPSIRRGGR